MGEGCLEVKQAIEKAQRALRVAGALEACVDEYVAKIQRTIHEFLDKLEGLARDMKEASTPHGLEELDSKKGAA